MAYRLYLAAAVMAPLATASPPLASSAQAATISRNCAVDNVAVIEARMHIKCAPIPTIANTHAIYYFAAALSEGPAKIESLVMLAIESKRIKKPLVIWYDPEDYASVPGCQGNNCRRLSGAALE